MKVMFHQKIILSLLSGLLLSFAYALSPVTFAPWVAPIPLLLIALKEPPHKSIIWGGLTGLVASLSLIQYLSSLSHPAIALGLSLLRAGQWAFVAFLVAFTVSNIPLFLQLFFYPALITSLELLITIFSPHGSGGSIAYSQMDFLPIIQLASIGGTGLIVFIMSLFASLIALLLVNRKRYYLSFSVTIFLLLASFFFGINRLNQEELDTDPVGVALIATDLFKGVPEDWRSVWEVYQNVILQQEDTLDEIFLLPEKVMMIHEDDIPEWKKNVKELVTGKFSLIVGIDERQGEKAYNRVYYFQTDGTVHLYDKQHMIPGFESHFEEGTQSLLVGDIGVAICKDMDFPQTIRNYSPAKMMLVPAWDFSEDAWFHSRMAMMRAVENGWPMLRSARQGYLTIADSKGRIISETTSGSEDISVLRGDLIFQSEETIYSNIGDAISYVAALLTVLLIVYAIYAKNNGSFSAHHLKIW